MCNIHRLIRYPFQIVVDLDRSNEKPEINGNGLMQSQDLQAFFFHIHFKFIYLMVAVDDLFRESGISQIKGLDSHPNTLFYHGSKRENSFF